MLSKVSQASLFKILYSSDKWVYTPNKSWDVFFQTYWPREVAYTLGTDLKLDVYNHLDILDSLKKY